MIAEYEYPYSATCPLLHGWRAVHSTTSYTSCCSRRQSRHNAPPLFPLPRTSVFTRAYPSGTYAVEVERPYGSMSITAG